MKDCHSGSPSSRGDCTFEVRLHGWGIRLATSVGFWAFLGVLGAPGLSQPMAIISDPGSDVGPTCSAAEGPEVVFQIPWGRGGSTLARKDGNESAPEGPMSFAISPDGEVLVLDQVEFRMVGFAPGTGMTFQQPLPADTFQDIELSPDGHILLLDRLAASVLWVMDRSGKVVGEYSILGGGIKNGGEVTAMFARDDGVWLEVGHLHLVQVLDHRLLPVGQRQVVQGRPSGKADVVLGAALDGVGGAQVLRRSHPSGQVLVERKVRFDHDVGRIIWLEADRAGNVHAFFHLMRFSRDYPFGILHEEVVGWRYDPDLNKRRLFQSPHTIRQWEQFKEFKVTPEGHVYQMAFTDDGVDFLRWEGGL